MLKAHHQVVNGFLFSFHSCASSMCSNGQSLYIESICFHCCFEIVPKMVWHTRGLFGPLVKPLKPGWPCLLSRVQANKEEKIIGKLGKHQPLPSFSLALKVLNGTTEDKQHEAPSEGNGSVSTMVLG